MPSLATPAHTDAAGWCLVSSAQRDGMRVISVVLGTPGKEARIASSQSLINYAFNFYETHHLYRAGETITTERVWKGDVETARLGLVEDIFVTIPRGQYEQLSASMNLPNMLIAPLDASEPRGSVVVQLDGETLAEAPLFSLDEVAQGSLVRRAIDEVRLWFE